ncbi:MAG: DUF4192 domain-containing protein, partial [Actinobacteria bacterium]|nr:DUF4192 domain-containing protein [Actinomycetota bacterium]
MDRTHTDLPTQQLTGTGELLQAVPYLLGFHPRQSLVLLGVDDRRLVVTARLDLADVPASVTSAVEVMVRGGSTAFFAAVYAPPPATAYRPVATAVMEAVDEYACGLLDIVLCDDDWWWTIGGCGSPLCCPPEGRPVPDEPSAFAAAATFDGVVVLSDRAELAAQLAPDPGRDPDQLDPLLAEAEHAGVQAALAGRLDRHERSAKRALFAAARAVQAGGAPVPDDPTVARFGVALSVPELRDSVWLAIDDGRLDGRDLWRGLGRRLPAPYSAAPLFLFGWASWRAGNATLAGIAATSAVEADPDYGAARLLLAAIAHGMAPQRTPRLRSRRFG